jgi:hypothetical protein
LTSPPDQAQIKPLGAPRQRISTTFETQPLLSLKGQCGVQGVRYETLVKVVAEGGTTAATGDHLVITGADAVTIVVHCTSDFRHADFGAAARAVVEKAAARPHADLRADHVADHRARMDRFTLSVTLPTDQAARAPCPPRCKASGTTPSPRPGTPSSPSTSTKRCTTGRPKRRTSPKATPPSSI